MDKATWFQHAIFFMAFLLKFRYVAWLFFGAISVLLIAHRVHPTQTISVIAKYLWWISLSTLVLLLISTATSWFLSNEDKYARLALYGLAIASSPVLIFCVVSLFFKPK